MSTATAIQSIRIVGHEERQESKLIQKTFVVYQIKVEASVRSWSIWRRYSEFVELHTELIKATGEIPPHQLPPKHLFFTRHTLNNAKVLNERKEGLETYLRAIISSKNTLWTETFAFKEFVGISLVGTENIRNDASGFTSSSWLEEQSYLQTAIREIRADINKRDELLQSGDMATAHSSGVQAKKKLASLSAKIELLATGLKTLGAAGLTEGEVQRRTNMILQLQEDSGDLARMLSIRNVQSTSQREKIFSGQSSGSTFAETQFRQKPKNRVFGVPKETVETRPLDDQGLLQFQQVQISRQDSELSQISEILHKQKALGIAIGNEIAEQNELLDDLSNDVDKVDAKLNNARRQMKRLG